MAERSEDWLRQAEWDLRHARHARDDQDYDWAPFAAQQAAEKAVKGLFQKLNRDAWGHTLSLLLANLPEEARPDAKLIEKAKALSPSTPAILFSSKVKFCERETVANVFLPKGMCEPVELLERIRVLLIRKRGPRKAVLPAPAYAAKSAGQMTAAS